MFVIDDDIIYRRLFVKTIQNHLDISDINIQEFDNGHSALNELIINPDNYPKQIFLDINMPIMDGWEFLDSVNELKIPIPNIYLVTSSNSAKDIDRAKQYQVKYFVKPIGDDELIKLINET